MRRSQASFEYLSNYFWAILILIISLALIAYYTLGDPTIFVTKRCLVSTGFTCVHSGVLLDTPSQGYGTFYFHLRNDQGKAVNYNSEVQFYYPPTGFTGVCYHPDPPSLLSVSVDEVVEFNCTGLLTVFTGMLEPGDKVMFEFEVKYNFVGYEYVQELKGSVVTNVV